MFRTDDPETEVKITGSARAMEKAKVLIEGKVSRTADSGTGISMDYAVHNIESFHYFAVHIYFDTFL